MSRLLPFLARLSPIRSGILALNRQQLDRLALAPMDVVRLGSDYGGWTVAAGDIGPGAVCVCAGAGEDITFDQALVDRGCTVVCVDPTPRAIRHVAAHRPASARFRFDPVGLWDRPTRLRFYTPRNAADVSHSLVNLQGSRHFIDVEVVPLATLLAKHHLPTPTVLKIDVEGAEHRVLANLLADGLRPTQICVEFDQPVLPRQLGRTLRRLRQAGYVPIAREAWNVTFRHTDDQRRAAST